MALSKQSPAGIGRGQQPGRDRGYRRGTHFGDQPAIDQGERRAAGGVEQEDRRHVRGQTARSTERT